MHEQMLRIVLHPCVEQHQEEESSAASWSPNSSIFCGLAAAACSDRQPRRLQPPDPLTPQLLQPDPTSHPQILVERPKKKNPKRRVPIPLTCPGFGLSAVSIFEFPVEQ